MFCPVLYFLSECEVCARELIESAAWLQASRAYWKPFTFRQLARAQASFTSTLYERYSAVMRAVRGFAWMWEFRLFRFVRGPLARAAAAAWPRARAHLITVISRRTFSLIVNIPRFWRHFCRVLHVYHTPPNTVREYELFPRSAFSWSKLK